MTCTDCGTEGADCLTADRVRVCSDCLYERVLEERDEARANHAAAVEAFHEATRLRSGIQQARIKAENERDEARAEVERLKAIESRWMKRTVEAEAHSRRIYEAACPGFSFNEADDVAWDVRAAKLNIANEAYQRGAEAMREAVASIFDAPISTPGRDVLLAWAESIRALPVPKDKK